MSSLKAEGIMEDNRIDALYEDLFVLGDALSGNPQISNWSGKRVDPKGYLLDIQVRRLHVGPDKVLFQATVLNTRKNEVMVELTASSPTSCLLELKSVMRKQLDAQVERTKEVLSSHA